MKKSLIIRGPQRTVLIGLLLAFVTLIPYWQVRDHGFIHLDDDVYVIANDHVKTGLTAKGIKWAFTTTYPDYWHPLPWLTLMLDHEIYGLDPAGYHITNLFFHIVNTLLLFFLLNRMTGALWRSALVAALFALHPLQVESVAWITERKGLMSALFWLLTMVCYAWYVQDPGLRRFCLLMLPFALGLMSKPMMMTLPFVLLLLDYWPFSRVRFGKGEGVHQKMKRWSARVLVLEKTPLLLLSAISLYGTLSLRQGENIIIPLEYRPPILRIGNALTSYVQYIGNMIWPHALAVFYPYPKALPLWKGAGAGLLLFAATLLIFRILSRHPYLATGWLWYLGTLVPVIGLVQWGQWPAMADRFTYIPLIGLYIMIVWGVSAMAAKWHLPKAALAIWAGTFLSGLIMGTWFQVGFWKNSIALFERTLEVTSENHLIQTTLGNALQGQGKTRESISHYREALRIDPRFVDAHNNLGIAFFKQGKMNEAIEHFQAALRYRPNDPKYHHNVGNAYMARGDLDSAGRAYNKAIVLKPDYPEALNNLGLYYVRKGSLNRAMSLFEKALTLRPDFVDALNNLGRIFHILGKFDRAIAATEKAIKLDPQNASLYTNLGLSLAQKGLFPKAGEAFHKALTINPANSKALNALATLDAKRGFMDRAIETRKKALAIDPYDAEAHYHISVEYYFKREYALALEHCDRAISLGYKEVEPDFLRHLEPFRHEK